MEKTHYLVLDSTYGEKVKEVIACCDTIKKAQKWADKIKEDKK